MFNLLLLLTGAFTYTASAVCPLDGVAGIKVGQNATGCIYCSPQEAVAMAPAGAKVFVQDGTYRVRDMTISRDVDIIAGNGTCDAAGQNSVVSFTGQPITGSPTKRLIKVSPTRELKLDGIHLGRGRAQGQSGGLILVQGGASLVMLNGSFINGRAANGGCVAANDDTILTFEGVDFSDCVANQGHGGAVYSLGEEVSMTSVKINDVSATQNGGAIHLAGMDGSLAWNTVEISAARAVNGNGGSVFLGNGSDLVGLMATIEPGVAGTSIFQAVNGGAIYAQPTEEQLTYIGLVDSNIEGQAAMTGGAIAIGDNSLALVGSEVSRSEATLGGAIYSEGGSVELSSTDVWGNEANYGGAIYFVSGTLDAGDELLEIDGASAVEFNEANYGGGIYAIGADSPVVIDIGDSVTFTDNNAEFFGGAIFVDRGEVALKDNVVIETSDADEGAAIYATQSDIVVLGDSWYRTPDAGHLAAPEGGVQLRENTSSSLGTAAIQAVDCNVTVNSAVFMENLGGNLGSGDADAIGLSNSTALISNAVFQENGGVGGEHRSVAVGDGSVLTMQSNFGVESGQCLPLATSDWSDRHCSEFTQNLGKSIIVSGDSLATVDTTAFVGNSSTAVVDIVADAGLAPSVELSSCLFMDNTPFGLQGIGRSVHVGMGGDLNARHNTFVDASMNLVYDSGSTGQFDGNIVQDAVAGMAGSILDAQGVLSGSCNVGAVSGLDPSTNDVGCMTAFQVGHARGRMRPALAGIDACISAVDACVSTLTIDLDGSPRPSVIYTGPTQWDRGAYEYIAP